MNNLPEIVDALLRLLPPIQDLAPVLPVLAIIAGGIALVAAGARPNNDALSRRIARVNAINGIEPDAEITTTDREYGTVAGFSDAEYRQLVRMFADYRVPAESVPAYFTALRLAIAGTAGTAVLLLVSAPHAMLTIVFALIAAMIGWFLPIPLVKRALVKHRIAVGDGLPETLELLAICVESGISLEHAILRVSQEMKHAQPALSDELAFTWAEISILPSRDLALENFADRVDIPMVRSVVGTLAQSLRYGSPLAQALRTAAAEMRNDQLLLLEERANRLPALMTIPVMVLIMPTIFLIVGGPAVIRMLDIFATQ
ncbi:MAG: type II secretion system F family protein [Hyphomicrobiales bacterium]|nr:type II secretion system F family protein [Hyphomicrobiales bacterium]